jgi:hypothetical protein
MSMSGQLLQMKFERLTDEIVFNSSIIYLGSRAQGIHMRTADFQQVLKLLTEINQILDAEGNEL